MEIFREILNFKYVKFSGRVGLGYLDDAAQLLFLFLAKRRSPTQIIRINIMRGERMNGSSRRTSAGYGQS
jgi:hypothetical protein